MHPKPLRSIVDGFQVRWKSHSYRALIDDPNDGAVPNVVATGAVRE